DRAPFLARKPLGMLAEIVRLFRRLRRDPFSLAIDFQGYGETAWMTRLSGAPQRWGNLYGASRRRAYTRGLQRDSRLDHVDWYLSLLEQCGLKTGAIVNEFVLPAEGLAGARQVFADHRIDPATATLFIQPFTSSAKKNWPIERQLAVARQARQLG